MTAFSFEFFPPKTEKAEASLWRTAQRLAPLRPEFVSVTYGAGGTTRRRTHDCVARLVGEMGVPVAAHLTCVAASRADVDAVIDSYAALGVRHIVALRGDMPDMGAFQPHPEGYASSVALVAAIKKRGDFEVSVSAYPEKHPESASVDDDIELLKAKIDAGASRAITQFVLDTDQLLRWRDRVQAAGIAIPILAGIMPTTNFASVQNMAAKCGVSVPAWLVTAYADMENADAARADVAELRQSLATGIAFAQCQKLTQEGFAHLHFYTLNQADFTFNVCRLLNAVEG